MVVLVDVRDPGNAGTVLRAADASGSTAVLFAGESVDPYNPKTVRASAGSLFHVPLAVRDDPFALASELSAAGFRTLATVVRDGEDYADLDWSVPTALFLGNESSGLDAALCGMFMAVVAILSLYSLAAVRRALAAQGPTALETPFVPMAPTSL